ALVAARREAGRDLGVGTVHPPPGHADLTPRARGFYDEHPRDVEADERVEVEAVETERAVAHHADDAAAEAGGADAESVPRPDAQAAEGPRVEPVTRPVHAQDARYRGDDVAAVSDHHRVLVQYAVELRAEPVVMDRRGVGLDLGAVGVPPCRLDRTEVLEPGGTISLRRCRCVGQRAEHRRAVPDDGGVRDAVSAQLAGVTVNVDQLSLPEAPIAKAEVERRPDDADD